MIRPEGATIDASLHLRWPSELRSRGSPDPGADRSSQPGGSGLAELEQH